MDNGQCAEGGRRWSVGTCLRQGSYCEARGQGIGTGEESEK